MVKRRYFNRKKSLARDGYTCVDCGSPDNLEIHHIDGNPANNHPSNAKTVCISCHLVYTRKQNAERSIRQRREDERLQDEAFEEDRRLEKKMLIAYYEKYGNDNYDGPDFGEFMNEYLGDYRR